MAKRTPKVREFVRTPFIQCPDCGSEGSFGVLMIGNRQYTRRCVECWYDQHIALPPIRKRRIYIDQFAVSNMMKAIDPELKETAQHPHASFFRQLFEKLDRLSKLQLIVCPDSLLHEHESIVDSRYRKLRAVFRQLSHGITCDPPERVRDRQILDAFDAWQSGNREPKPLPSRFPLSGDPDTWNDRLRIELNANLPDLAAELTARKQPIDEALHQVFEEWRADKEFSFERVYQDEVSAYAKNILKVFFRFTAMMAAVQSGQTPPSLETAFPPSSVSIMTAMLGRLVGSSDDVGKRLERIGEFFRSDHFRSLPYVRIGSLFWASIAREINGGRKPSRYPKSGMFNDIDAVAAYSPYVDAMFMDKETSHFASQRELREELSGKARIFSLRANEKEAFMQYLEEIEANALPDHLKLVSDVYGESWPEPFVELLSVIRDK